MSEEGTNSKRTKPITFLRDLEYGFWKQQNPEPFKYDINYKQKQSTNTAMSMLRIGWLSNFFSIEYMDSMSVVDIGSGNENFIHEAQGVFNELKGYDLDGPSITEKELMETHWDMVVLSDVLEHFADIEGLYEMTWDYAFISYPETPEVNTQEELEQWRHFKPDEHIWCLNWEGMKKWFLRHGSRVIGHGNFEDIIRTRWEGATPNITSVLIER